MDDVFERGVFLEYTQSLHSSIILSTVLSCETFLNASLSLICNERILCFVRQEDLESNAYPVMSARTLQSTVPQPVLPVPKEDTPESVLRLPADFARMGS